MNPDDDAGKFECFMLWGILTVTYLPPPVHARAEVVGVASDHAVDHAVGLDLQVQHDDAFPDTPRLDSFPALCDQ